MPKATLWLWILSVAFGAGALIASYYVDRWAKRRFERQQLYAWTAHLSKPMPGRWGRHRR